MINKAQKIILAGLLALSMGLLPALAQVTSAEPGETTGSDMARRVDEKPGSDKRPPERHRERRGDRDDRDRRRYDPEAFRQLMNETLNEVPTLNRHMQRLQDIQAKRFELQKQRQVVARAKDSTRETIVRKFHVLLKQDQHLSDDARGIVHGIIKDMPEIQGQLDQRRSKLDAELAKANAAHTDVETSSPEVKELRRKVRYVDFLEKKLEDLKTRPDRLDLLARVLKGLPPNDPLDDDDDGDNRESTPEERLAELLLKRQRLQRELRQVEHEIKQLRNQGVNEQTATAPAAEKE